jgi:hypothetical protein
MSFIPYPDIPYKIIHMADIVLILTLGFLYELAMPIWRHRNERWTPQECKSKIHLATLRHEVLRKHALGPSTFVETSKLERAILAAKKELTKLEEEREARKAGVAKSIWKCNVATNAAIIAAYWGVVMVVIDGSHLYRAEYESSYGDKVITDAERASTFWKGFLFLLSYNRMAYKIAQLGIDSSLRPSCLGALAVFWAARVTCGEVVDCALQLVS